MPICNKCGIQSPEGTKFCPGCGNNLQAANEDLNNNANPRTNPNPAPDPGPRKNTDFSGMFDTPDTTGEYDANDVQQNKVMAVLSYFSLLVLIPIFAAKDSKFAKFHANQGLILLIASVGWSIASSIVTSILTSISWRLYFVGTILSALSLAFLVLAILGIVNAANGKAKELPFIGKFKILK